jgi:RHS repeat-associated protein
MGFGQGGGGLAIVPGPSSSNYTHYQTLTGDYDGDGYHDLYVATTSTPQWHVFRGSANGLAPTPILTELSATGNGWMLTDQNGDGLPDLGRYDVSTLVWSTLAHAGVPGEQLESATDGLGNKVSLTYLPMTEDAVYAKGSGAAAPVIDVEFNASLVRVLQIEPAGGSPYFFAYRYHVARSHTQGRGFLGMARREITDSRNGVFTTENYRQDFPYIGALGTVTVKQSDAANARTITAVTHTYANHELDATSGNQRYLPYRSQTVTEVHEVGGIRNGDLITEVTETHTVNTFGNSTFVAIDVNDKDALSLETGQVYRTEITSTFAEDTGTWCMDPPLTRSEKHILPAGTNKTRSASWNVATAECRVTQETLEPGAGSVLSLITDVGYDTCGNVSSLTSQPAGTTGQARMTTISYGSRCQRPETITNPEAHVTNLAYNWPLGLPATHMDPNGLVTTLEYDGFSRLTRRLRPDGTAARFALTACTAGNSWCGKNSSARVKVARTERNTSNGVLRTDEVYLDGLGRTRWAHSDSLESGPAIVETLYDAFNRPTGRTQPYFAGNPVYASEYEYDLIGRITSIDAPINEGQTSGRVTGFAYEGRDTKITDPENMISMRRSNVLGQLRAITDPGTGGITAYTYHPFGELASIKDANGNVTSWAVNDRGFVDATSDPDSGNWTYEVTAFGETTKIRDAKASAPSWTTQFTFDKLSRPLTRVESEGTTTFTWGKASDNTANNKYIGRLRQVTSPGGYVELYRFDSKARLDQLRTTIEGTNYFFNQTYDPATGLAATLKYPTSTGTYRHEIAFAYQNNLLRSVTQVGGSLTAYWTGTSTDAFGHYQYETLGNGVIAFTDFDQASGLMTSREAGVGGGTGRINSLVDWHADLRGNFTQRQDLKLTPAVTEVFLSGAVPGNDALGRVDYSTRNGTQNFDVTLDPIGNITAKDGLTYLYTGSQAGCTYYAHSQPRAVRKIGGTVYCYDANGNMTKRGGSTISYTSYNLPTAISSGSNSSTLTYGAFRNRYKQVAVSSGTTETTLYVTGGMFEKVTRPSGVIEYRHYLPGGSGTAAIYTRRSSGGNSTYYWHADHLGSPELFTDSAGTALVRPSFGAYGERRDGSDWSGPPSAGDLTTIGNVTRRGFTGHEHLDAVGLIHMNGRVYDPTTGRFLSRDPLIDGVFSSQGPNGYAYVHNNPLAFVDPSGFDLCDVTAVCHLFGGGGHEPSLDPGTHNVHDWPTLAGLRGNNAVITDIRALVSMQDATLRAIRGAGRAGSTVGGTGQAIVNATVPGAFYGGQAELAFREGRYLIGATFSVAALADAALGVLTLGRSTALNSTLRTTVPVAQRGISVLGRNPAYVQLGEAIPSRYLNVPTWVWNRMSSAEQWAANTRFLDRLIARGDEVYLATRASAAPPGSFFARELEYLTSRGYTISDDGWRLLPPVP